MAYVVEAVVDTLRTLPVLLAVLIAIEALEHRFGGRLGRGLAAIGRWGPAIGAGVGALPQCGGAVVASELYAARAVTLGTLLAVYLSTSDEALPILLANPAKLAALGPLLLTKISVGLLAGYAVDLLSARRGPHYAISEAGVALSEDGGTKLAQVEHHHDGGSVYETHACLEGRLSLPALTGHALRRGARVAVFLTATTALLNWLTAGFSPLTPGGALFGHTSVQVLASASFGLIPSCAPSVAMTDLFVKGALGYPALIAGLCANAGAGLMVLLHESGWRTALRVATLLLIISIGTGLILSLF